MDSVYLDMITKNLTPEQKMLFTELYGEQKKSTGIAYIFLILLGQVGGQKFYLNHPHKWLYLLFCWTCIPSIIALIELFTMSKIVTKHNNKTANDIITVIKTYEDTNIVRRVVKESNKSPVVGIVIGAIIVIIIIAIVGHEEEKVSNTQKNTPTSTVNATDLTPPQPTSTVIKVSASNLYKEYEQNEARADEKYKNKTLSINGVVGEIHKQTSSITTVSLDAGTYGLDGVECDIDSDNNILHSISKGDNIILIGEVDGNGLTGNAIQLKNGCHISN